MTDHPKGNHRVPWTVEADDELRRRVEGGEFVPHIAAAMGRSQEAIRTRAGILKLAIRFASNRRPRNRVAQGEGSTILLVMPRPPSA